jgi:hypothetical protein
MSDYIKVKDNDSLVRDAKTGAILNIDQSEYENFRIKALANKNMKTRLDLQEKDIQEIKSDIADIKQLLLALFANK